MSAKTRTILIRSKTEMQKVAAQLAHSIVSVTSTSPSALHQRRATVIALQGELGAGKTTFAQGFLKALGVKSHVSSPTFLIIKPHRLHYTLYPNPYTLAYHIDCYRLKKPQELLALGFKDILKNPKYIILIEWSELVKKYLPRTTRWITIHHGEKKTERIVVL